MKWITLFLAAALFLPVTSSQALTPQQEKMKTCNADATAKGLKGEDRKVFMKKCLANAPAKPAEAPATGAPGIVPSPPSPPPAVPAPPIPTPQTVPSSPR